MDLSEGMTPIVEAAASLDSVFISLQEPEDHTRWQEP